MDTSGMNGYRDEYAMFVERRKELDTRERALRTKESDLARRQSLFDMQWKLLEKELLQLADDRDKLRREKELMKQSADRNHDDISINDGRAKIFFLGVHDLLSLKKRYRDLLKIFHPDSMNGDVNAMQAINREYEKLRMFYEEGKSET